MDGRFTPEMPVIWIAVGRGDYQGPPWGGVVPGYLGKVPSRAGGPTLPFQRAFTIVIVRVGVIVTIVIQCVFSRS
jgi:hypothetical protein